MSEKPYKSSTQMDEDLAEFTDRILSDQSVEDIEVNEELRLLKDTVSQLKATLKTPSAEATMRQIEKQFINEWNENRNVEKKPAIWEKFWSGSRSWKSQPQRRLTLAFVLTTFFLIVIMIFPINQLITPNIQASAGVMNQYQPVLFVVAIILVIGLLWFGRNKS